MNKTVKNALQAILSILIAVGTVMSVASCNGQSKTAFKAVNLRWNDKNNIAKLLVNCGNVNYDSSDPNDEDTALLLTIGPVYGCWWMFQDCETEKNRESYYILDDTGEYVKDPLELFDPDNEEGITGYSKYDGDAVDQLIRNVFNKEPTHNSTPKAFDVELVMDSLDSTVKLKYYYYKGYYYAEEAYGICGMNGEGIVFDSIVSDGTDYHIKYRLSLPSLSDESKNSDTEVRNEETLYTTIKKNTYNGKEYWSVVKLGNKADIDFSHYDSLAYDETWKATYIHYINKCNKENEFNEYSLAYIDGDDIPELIINGDTMANGGQVCTVWNGKVNSMDVWYQGISYLEGENAFIVSSGRMHEYSDEIYKIENGSFQLTAKGTYGLSDIDIYGDDVEAAEKHYRYYWNDNKVSKNMYHNNLKKTIDVSHAKDPYEISFDYSEIISFLESTDFTLFPSSLY